jgi:hypothetical protein
MIKFNSIFAISKQINLNLSQQLNRQLIRKEAKIGGTLFGPVPKNHRREFFCLDERTWVWHEEWYDNSGHLQFSTTRYEIHSDKIIKIQNGEHYQLDRNEAINFYKAAKLYNRRIRSEIYALVS